MTRTACLLISLLCATLPAGEMITVTHWSDALSAEATYDVFIPDGDAPEAGWPVLHMLHGAWGNHTDWWQQTEVEDVANEEGVMLVFPDGGQFGWYVDSPISPESRYETRIVDEIIPEVDNMFPTRRDRAGRGICGLSMGGHGAISLGMKHPDLFGSASSLSGILDLTSHPTSWEIYLRLGPLDENRETWEANSCLQLADNLASGEIQLLFDCGVDDYAAIDDNRALDERLEELGIEHSFIEYPGAHTWNHWREHVPEHVRWHAERFR